MKKLIPIGIVCAVAVLTSCSLNIITPTETTIKAENNLTNLSIVVSGSTTKVTAIDLADVTIGDVFFSYIQGGTSTASKVTYKTGSVNIYIDTAIVLAKVLGFNQTLLIIHF